MKKTFSVSISLVCALALLLISAGPVSAAGFVVSAVDLTRSGTVNVYLEGASGPVNTMTFSGFDGYYTSCGPNGNNGLVCHIYGTIAQKHGGQTAYIMMNGERVFFTVPEFVDEPRKNNCDNCDDRARCCEQ